MSERMDDSTRREELEISRAVDENDAQAETAEIRAGIQETRERMSDNLEQLGERLNPGNIKDRMKQDVREATIGKVENMAQSAADRFGDAKDSMDEARRTVIDLVRENPIPAAMAGIGLGWLAYNARQQRPFGDSWARHRVSRMGRGRYRGVRGETGYGAWRGYGAGERGEEEGAVDRVRDRAEELSGQARQRTGEMADRAEGTAGNIVDESRYRARRLEDRFHENPLAIGAAALTLGVAAGLAIPESRTEQEWMGGARDRLADRAREVAAETKDKVENVVDRVADQAQSTAKSAARDEGLTAS